MEFVHIHITNLYEKRDGQQFWDLADKIKADNIGTASSGIYFVDRKKKPKEYK